MSVLNAQGIRVHCSASRHGDAAEIKLWHTLPKPKGNGWADIGYHGVILNGVREHGDDYMEVLDGKIEPGREDTVVGAHCLAQGMNSVTLGVCLVGSPGWRVPGAAYSEQAKRAAVTPKLTYATERQLAALVHYCAVKCKRFQLDPEGLFKFNGRQYFVLDQHSKYDAQKPLCASLSMEWLRKQVATHIKSGAVR